MRDLKVSDLRPPFLPQVETIAGRRHAHVVELLHFCEEAGERVLVYEFMDRGSLRGLLHRQKNGTRSEYNAIQKKKLPTTISFLRATMGF